LVDEIISSNPKISLPPEKDKKDIRHNLNYAPKPVYYDLDIVKSIYETGLHDSYTRYFSAYQLGRYYKHVLNLDKPQARGKIIEWLKRHFAEQCNDYNGLTPFEGAYSNIIKSPYVVCEDETLRNCMNGYNNGKPFRQERVVIDTYQAQNYIWELKYTRKQICGLYNILGMAIRHNRLNLYLSQERLREMFNVKSRTTVYNWLKEFQQDNILECIKQGSNYLRKSSLYRLLLPSDCYRELEDNELIEDNPQYPCPSLDDMDIFI
jgi:hypothetical protein